MLSRLSSHVRHNVVAYLALFFALSGGAFAANTYIRTTDTIPSSSDLTGTYGNPLIANGKVTSGKLADGSVTTSKFDSGAKAPDADKLDGLNSTAFGAGALMGQAQCLGCSNAGPRSFYVAPTGSSELDTSGDPAEKAQLTPNAVLRAGDLAVRVGATTEAGAEATVTLQLEANTVTSVSCTVVFDGPLGNTCHSGNLNASIPAGSAVYLRVDTNAHVLNLSHVIFGWRLTGPE